MAPIRLVYINPQRMIYMSPDAWETYGTFLERRIMDYIHLHPNDAAPRRGEIDRFLRQGVGKGFLTVEEYELARDVRYRVLCATERLIRDELDSPEHQIQ